MTSRLTTAWSTAPSGTSPCARRSIPFPTLSAGWRTCWRSGCWYGSRDRALEARNLGVRNFQRVTELGSLNLIKSLVCAGAGISFFYQPVVQRELESGQLREIPLEDCSIYHDFTFLWRRGSLFAADYREIFSLLRQGLPFPSEAVDSGGENLHNEDRIFLERKKESL